MEKTAGRFFLEDTKVIFDTLKQTTKYNNNNNKYLLLYSRGGSG